MQLNDIKQQIISLLKPLDPEQIILFGSYAWGEPSADSDIDLYIVTNDSTMPATYRERSEIYLRYAKALDGFIGTVPVDMIVHTRPMHLMFLELDSMFSRKIIHSGIPLV